MSCFGSFWEKGSSSSLKMSRSGFGILCAWDTPKKMRHDQDPDIQVQYILRTYNMYFKHETKYSLVTTYV
jgi:hypothetical protein